MGNDIIGYVAFGSNVFRHYYFFRHTGETVLRKHLRTFEENQISNIIRRTKGKGTLNFHQFYSAKNPRRDTHKSRNPFFLNWKQQKAHLFQRKTLKKNRKLRKIFSKFF